jgi:hypothetical protein
MGINKIQMELHTKLLFVRLNINGKKGCFLVDTGANISALDIKQMNEYNFGHNDVDSPVTGVGGKWTIYEATNVIVDYNGEILNINFTVNDLTHVREALSEYVNLLGIIGGDFLVKNNMVIDYKENIMYQSK